MKKLLTPRQCLTPYVLLVKSPCWLFGEIRYIPQWRSFVCIFPPTELLWKIPLFRDVKMKLTCINDGFWLFEEKWKFDILHLPSDCQHQFSNFPVIPCREQVNFQWDDDEVHFVLDQHAELDFYSASSLKQQSAGRHVAPLWHIILIPSQPVFALSL